MARSVKASRSTSSRSTSSDLAVSAAQAAAFRLQRHHLAPSASPKPPAPSPVSDVVRASAGIQAQVMSAAEIAIWTRRRVTTRDEIGQALWTSRDLVRTSAMRLTLHVLPAADFAVYVAALKSRMMAFLQGYLSRAGAKPPHVQAMIRSVAESVEDGPKTRQELLAAARKKVGRAMRGWLDQSWSGVRPAVIDGAIVYGPPRGAEATYIATDAWLGPQPAWDVEDARLELLRRFLSAFGPATPHDFAKWSGLKTSDARQLIAKAGDELAIVSVDGAHGSILRRDLAPLSRCELDRDAVTLLGAFDSFLLAHATKEHLVDARFYTRVYRPQGWISPVVLRGGTVAGVWFPTRVKGEMRVDVELFVRSTPAVRRAVEQEVEAMSQFLAVRCQVRFKTSSRQA